MKRISIFIFILILFNGLLGAQSLQEVIDRNHIPFEQVGDFEQLFDELDDRKLVLMGEATHGTSEFYVWRAELSKYLIEQKGFNYIAVEADWPAFSRINAFVKRKPGAPETIDEAMDYLDRWPLWMWRNQEVKSLVQWLRDYNRDLAPDERVGIYGVDLYAKQEAMRDVVDWLATFDEDVSRRAERSYRCLSRISNIQSYLTRVRRTGDDCSSDVEEVLEIVQGFSEDPGHAGSWEYFNAEQNAKLVINAERHYRANLEGGPAAWNYRASHFELTASRLLEYYGDDGRGIVWAHNTHIGDARATDMARQGAVNIGQLSREKWGVERVYSIGFGTYSGQVYAARQWEGAKESMQIPEGIDGSWENMLYDSGSEQFYLLFSIEELRSQLDRQIPHRAIGVTYDPQQDRGNYVNTVLPERYNAFIFFRETGVLDTLD